MNQEIARELRTTAAPEADLALAPDLFATAHRFLWHAATRTAILADVHLGIEAALLRQGLYLPGLPPPEMPALLRAWARLKARNPARVVIAGDLFDATEPEEAAEELCRRLLRALPPGCRIIITPGNHDPEAEILRGMLSGLPVSVCGHFRVGANVISHGHERPDAEVLAAAAAWIVGHQHPAVIMKSRVQAVKMACFAVCGGGAERIILLPAFSRAPLGSNLLTDSNWLLPSPRPTEENICIAGLVEPASGESRILDFGPLANLA